MAQTAVEWLIDNIKINLATLIGPTNYYIILEQARAMDKEHHRETWLESRIESKGDDYIGKEKTFEEYYKETYGE